MKSLDDLKSAIEALISDIDSNPAADVDQSLLDAVQDALEKHESAVSDANDTAESAIDGVADELSRCLKKIRKSFA